MNIIINGATRGIGRETALRMSADRDNQILITGRNEAEMKKMVNESTNENITFVKLDLAEIKNEIESLKHQIYNRFSSIDILLNIAGSLIVKDFMKLSDEECREMMDVNFFGPAALTRLVVPLCRGVPILLTYRAWVAFRVVPSTGGCQCTAPPRRPSHV